MSAIVLWEQGVWRFAGYLHVCIYTCMRMQVVKSPIHMPSVTAKRWGVGFFMLNSEVTSN